MGPTGVSVGRCRGRVQSPTCGLRLIHQSYLPHEEKEGMTHPLAHGGAGAIHHQHAQAAGAGGALAGPGSFSRPAPVSSRPCLLSLSFSPRLQPNPSSSLCDSNLQAMSCPPLAFSSFSPSIGLCKRVPATGPVRPARPTVLILRMPYPDCFEGAGLQSSQRINLTTLSMSVRHTPLMQLARLHCRCFCLALASASAALTKVLLPLPQSWCRSGSAWTPTVTNLLP